MPSTILLLVYSNLVRFQVADRCNNLIDQNNNCLIFDALIWFFFTPVLSFLTSYFVEHKHPNLLTELKKEVVVLLSFYCNVTITIVATTSQQTTYHKLPFIYKSNWQDEFCIIQWKYFSRSNFLGVERLV